MKTAEDILKDWMDNDPGVHWPCTDDAYTSLYIDASKAALRRLFEQGRLAGLEEAAKILKNIYEEQRELSPDYRLSMFGALIEAEEKLHSKLKQPVTKAEEGEK